MAAENGNRVKVQFVGKLKDGTVFGKSAPERPLEFTLGKDGLIQGFDEAVCGMEPGQEKTIEIPPEKGFGQYDPEKLLQLDRGRLAEREPLSTGMKVGVKDAQGNEFVGRVNVLTNSSVTLDLNHPLAGQSLQFDIRLQEIV